MAQFPSIPAGPSRWRTVGRAAAAAVFLMLGTARAETLPEQLQTLARNVPAGTAALLDAARSVPDSASPRQRLDAWRGAVVASLWDDAGLEDRSAVEAQALAVLPQAIEVATQLQDRATLGVLLAYQATSKYWQSFKPRVDKALLEQALESAKASGDATAQCLVLIRHGVSGYAYAPASQWVTSTLAAARLTEADPVCRATAFYVTLALNGYGGNDGNPDSAQRAAKDVDEAATLVPFERYPSLGNRLLVAREYQRLSVPRPDDQSALKQTSLDGLMRTALAQNDIALLMAARVFKATQEAMAGRLDAAIRLVDEAMAMNGLGVAGRLGLSEWAMSIYSLRPATHGQRARELADAVHKLLGPDAATSYMATYYGAAILAMVAVGDYKRAYEAQAALEKHNAAVMLNSQITAINEANIRFDVERKEFENQQLALRRNLLTGLLVLSSIALCVVAWLLRRQVLQARRITELYQRLDERNRDLVALSASRSEFLAGACHDLRQPAHALSLLTEVASSRPGAGTRYLPDIRRNTLVLTDMLSALLDITQLERGDYRASIVPVSLGPMLEEVKAQFAGTAARKGLSLQVVPTSSWASSDVYLLRRILSNLVSNACKYTDRGGVQLSVQVIDDDVRIEVTDTGRGIPADRQADMLRPYTRIDHAAAEEGLGIGLSIVQRATQLLGHTLTIDSRVGHGTTMSVTLPRCAPAKVAAEPAPSMVVKPGTRVIVVEDNEDVRLALTELLSDCGFIVLVAESAASLAQQLAEGNAQRPALALVDYSIGNDDGLKIVQHLRQRPGWDELPAILVTGSVSTEIEQRAREMGVQVLLKPARPSHLLRLVSRALLAPEPAAAVESI